MIFLQDLSLDLELALSLLVEILSSYAALIRSSASLSAQLENVLAPALERFLTPGNYCAALCPTDKHYFSLLRLILLDYASIGETASVMMENEMLCIENVRSEEGSLDQSCTIDDRLDSKGHGGDSTERLLKLLSMWLSFTHPTHTKLTLELLADIFPSILAHKSLPLLLQAMVSFIQQGLSEGIDNEANMHLALQIVFSLFEALGSICNGGKVEGKKYIRTKEYSPSMVPIDLQSYGATVSLAGMLLEKHFIGDAENRLCHTLCIMGFGSPEFQADVEVLWAKWVDTCISDAYFSGAELLLDVVEVSYTTLSPRAWLKLHMLYLAIKKVSLIEGAEDVPRQLEQTLELVYGRPEIISRSAFFVSFAKDLLGTHLLLGHSSGGSEHKSVTTPLERGVIPSLPGVIFEEVLFPQLFRAMLPLQGGNDGWVLLARTIFVEMIMPHPNSQIRVAFFTLLVKYLTCYLPQSLSRALEVISVVMTNANDETLLSAAVSLAFQLIDDGQIGDSGGACKACCLMGPWLAQYDAVVVEANALPTTMECTERLSKDISPSKNENLSEPINDPHHSPKCQTIAMERLNGLDSTSISTQWTEGSTTVVPIYFEAVTDPSIAPEVCNWGRLFGAIRTLLLRSLKISSLCALVERRLVPLLTTISQNDALQRLTTGHCAELISNIELVLRLPVIELNTQVALLGLLWTISDEVLSRISNGNTIKVEKLTDIAASAEGKDAQADSESIPEKSTDTVAAVVALQLHLYGALAKIAITATQSPIREGALQMLFRAIALHQRQGVAHWTAIFEGILIPLLWRLPMDAMEDNGPALVLIGVEGTIDIFVAYVTDLQRTWIATVLLDILVPVVLEGTEKIRLALLEDLTAFVTSIRSTARKCIWRQQILSIVFETWFAICGGIQHRHNEKKIGTQNGGASTHHPRRVAATTSQRRRISQQSQTITEPHALKTDAMLEMVRVFRELFIVFVGDDGLLDGEWTFLERLFCQGLLVFFSICTQGDFGAMKGRVTDELLFHHNPSPDRAGVSERLKDAILRNIGLMVDFLLRISSSKEEDIAIRLGRAFSFWHLNTIQKLAGDPIACKLITSFERLLNGFGHIGWIYDQQHQHRQEEAYLCRSGVDGIVHSHRDSTKGETIGALHARGLALVRGLHCHILGADGALFNVLVDRLRILPRDEALRHVTFSLLQLLLTQVAQILRWLLVHRLGPPLTDTMAETLFRASVTTLRMAVDVTSEYEEELLVINLDTIVVDSEVLLGMWISDTHLKEYLSLLIRCITFAPASTRHAIGVFREQLALKAFNNLILMATTMNDHACKRFALSAMEELLAKIERACTAPQALVFSTLPAERYVINDDDV